MNKFAAYTEGAYTDGASTGNYYNTSLRTSTFGEDWKTNGVLKSSNSSR
jgi:hypothetical protein